jgi:hypothetical protein
MGSKINGRWKKSKKPEGEKQAGVSSGRLRAHLHCWTKQSRCAFALLVQHVPFQFISCVFILFINAYCDWYALFIVSRWFYFDHEKAGFYRHTT